MESGLPVGSKHQHTACETKSSQACDDTKTGSTSSSYERRSICLAAMKAVLYRIEKNLESQEYRNTDMISCLMFQAEATFASWKYYLPRNSESVISCTLSTVVLPPHGSKKEHMCLSHRWKPGRRSHQILIDGRTLTVQTNVYQFLKLARERYAIVPIWIDTICINQGDADEKSHQVLLMREIYHQAQVVSYLGGDNPIMETCIKMICQRKSPKNSFDAGHPVTGDGEAGVLLDGCDYLLLHLMNNEYWERSWIIQELLLGGQGVVLIGQTEIPWDRLFQYTRLLSEPHNHLSSPRPEVFAQSPLATIARHKKEGSGFTPLNLPELLSQFVNVRSHDFHDRIYALLGLAKDRDRVTVDYGSTKEDFFFDNLKSICEKRGINNSMSCLCVCTHIIYAIGLERTFFAPQPELNYNSWALTTRLRVESHVGSLRTAFCSPGQPYISLEILGRNVHGLTPKPHGIDIQLYDVYKGFGWRQNFKSTTIFIQGDFNTWHGEPSFTFTEATDRSHWYCSAIFDYSAYESLVEFSEGDSAGIWLSVEGPLTNSQMRLYLTREALLGLVLAMGQSHHVCDLVQTYTFVENNEQGYDKGEMQSSRLYTRERFDNWLSTKVPANHGWSYYPDEGGDWNFTRGGMDA